MHTHPHRYSLARAACLLAGMTALLGLAPESVRVASSATTQPATRPVARSTTRPATRPALSKIDGAIPIRGTLEAAMDYVRVQVQLHDDDKIVTGTSTGLSGLRNIKDVNDLEKLLNGGVPADQNARDQYFTAFLDTGASAHVISKSTAARFGIQPSPGAVYHEVGLHGETAMGVSKAYRVSISDADAPDAARFTLMHRQAHLQMSQADTNPLVEMLTGEVNIIGMPAIRQLVVEIHPGSVMGNGDVDLDALANLDITDLQNPELLSKLEKLEAGPAVRLHPAGTIPGAGAVDVEVQLEEVCYSRRKNPHDKGQLPELADNPTVAGVRTEYRGRSFVGRWLLDTGAPASLISTKHAMALGLYDAEGRPTREPDFELPLGGIGGKVESVPGFRISRLLIPAANGKALDYRNVYVLVTDVSTSLDDGSVVTLDGILGSNLWFPTVAGLSSGFPNQAAPSAFETMWIDGPGKRLLFKLRPQAATTQRAKP